MLITHHPRPPSLQPPDVYGVIKDVCHHSTSPAAAHNNPIKLSPQWSENMHSPWRPVPACGGSVLWTWGTLALWEPCAQPRCLRRKWKATFQHLDRRRLLFELRQQSWFLSIIARLLTLRVGAQIDFHAGWSDAGFHPLFSGVHGKGWKLLSKQGK